MFLPAYHLVSNITITKQQQWPWVASAKLPSVWEASDISVNCFVPENLPLTMEDFLVWPFLLLTWVNKLQLIFWKLWLLCPSTSTWWSSNNLLWKCVFLIFWNSPINYYSVWAAAFVNQHVATIQLSVPFWLWWWMWRASIYFNDLIYVQKEISWT